MPVKVYKRKGGKTWAFRGTVDGKRLRGTTGVSITLPKATAERVAAKIEAKYWKRDLDGPGSTLTFARAVTLYEAAGKPMRFLRPIEDHWKDTLVNDMTEGDIIQSAVDLYPTQAGATRNRNVIIPTQAVINHAARRKLCQRITVERFKSMKKIKKPVDLEWCREFMKHSPPHLGALALFMFLTAARVSHALRVTWDDIDLKRHEVRLRETKVSKERFAHLPQELVIALANIRRGDYGRTKGDTVFRYVDRASADGEWRKVWERADIERLTPHCCRHGFATTMLRKGVDVKTVMWLGGWEDAKLFMDTYAHAINDVTLTNRIIDAAWTQEVLEKARNPMIAAVS